jgi:hypothetical protein
VTESGGPPVAVAPPWAESPVGPGAESPAPTTPLPPKPNRTRVYAAIAVVVVVVLILLALVATQALPLLPSSKSSGSVLTYQEARQVSDPTVAGYQGGGWALLVAAGLDSPTSESVPTNSSASGTGNCTLTLASGASATVSIPAFTGSRTAGVAPVWEFLYRNAAGSVALVTVADGVATVIGTIGGGLCSLIFGLLSPVPTSAIDSSQAAAAVATDAASFLAEYPNASAEFGLIGGVSLGAGVKAEWAVTYSTCLIGPSASGTGTRFNATVNATDGEVVSYQTTMDVSCGSSSTTATVLGMAPLPLGESSMAMRPPLR